MSQSSNKTIRKLYVSIPVKICTFIDIILLFVRNYVLLGCTSGLCKLTIVTAVPLNWKEQQDKRIWTHLMCCQSKECYFCMDYFTGKGLLWYAVFSKSKENFFLDNMLSQGFNILGIILTIWMHSVQKSVYSTHVLEELDKEGFLYACEW